MTVEKDGIRTEAFVRMKKNGEPSAYDDIDQRDTFFRSHLASLENEGHPKSLFVTEFETPEGASVTIHAQEFRPAESGFDYEAAVSCDALDESQKTQIRDIASKLAHLHLSPLPVRDATPESYERGVLELLINSELTYPTLAHFPPDHPFFGHVDAKYDYLSKMARAADRQIARKNDRRCRRLHGDFWHSNVLFDENGCYFIDFSRTPAGEAGIDVGWFLGNVALDAYLLGKNGAKETFDLFLETYVRFT
ncbi:MAG: hypothetical protein QG650_826 [Patescibacteria group bacterium]|nr:hypothetical protein [Patescibacteria group bacterium]